MTSGVDQWWPDQRTDDEIAQAAARQRALQQDYQKQLADEAKRYQVITHAEAHDRWLDEVNRPVEGAISTGWPSIDRGMGRSIRQGEVVIIAARTGVGKSWVVQSMVEQKLAEDHAAACLFLPLEMTEFETAGRMVAHALNLPPEVVEVRAREGLVEAGDVFIERRAQHLARLVHYPRPNTPVSDLPKVIEAAGQIGVAPTIVVIDYLGLMGADAKMNDYQRASHNARQMKEVAKGYGVTIIAASQLSRGNVRDGAAEPSMHDLRDSGVIEEAADRILMFWREAEDDDVVEGARILAKVEKNRHGPRGARCVLEFSAAMTLREVTESELYSPAES